MMMSPHQHPRVCNRLLRWLSRLVAASLLLLSAEAEEQPGKPGALDDLKPYLLLAEKDQDLSVDHAAEPGFNESAPAESLRELILSEGTFLKWSERAGGIPFNSDHVISWSGEGRIVLLSLSLATAEALLEVPKDEKKLLYAIDKDAGVKLVRWFADREREAKARKDAMLAELRSKSEPVESSAGWRSAVSNAANLLIHEGLPHPSEKSFAAEAARKDVRTLDGQRFYTPGVTANDPAGIAEIVSAAGTYHRFSGAKECGGFHADFALSWRSGEAEVNLLICYGCHEVLFTDGTTTLKYDLDHEAGRRLRQLLTVYGKKRPMPKAE